VGEGFERDRETAGLEEWRHDVAETDRQTDGVEERHHDVAEDVDRQRPLVPLGLHPDDRALQLAPSHQQKN